MAIDWMSEAVVLKTQSMYSISTSLVKLLLKYTPRTVVFNNFSHWTIGCYCIEWLLSLKFEWSVLKRERVFRWPMVVCTAQLGSFEDANPTALQLYFYTKWSVLRQYHST